MICKEKKNHKLMTKRNYSRIETPEYRINLIYLPKYMQVLRVGKLRSWLRLLKFNARPYDKANTPLLIYIYVTQVKNFKDKGLP